MLKNEHAPVFANVDVTRAITVDTKNRVWIGTSGKGLTRYNTNTQEFKAFRNRANDNTSIPSDRIVSLFTGQDSLWIGYQDRGLSILHNGTFKNFSEETTPALSASTIWSISDGPATSKWLGTRKNGLLLFNTKKGIFKQFKNNVADSLSIASNNIRIVLKQNDSILWIGTEENGVNKFLVEQETFIRYNNPSIKNVKSLHIKDSILWVGTNGNGLQALNTSTGKTYGYTTKEGLPNNVIYGILPDEKGNLWLSSNKGITRFYVEKPDAIAEITNYDTSDGLQAREFNTGAYFKNNDGTLYFGGLNGINWFNPERMSKNLIPPKTVLSSVELFNKEIPFSNTSEFTYKENTFSFIFTGLHFSQPERNQFKYILEGYNTQWSSPSTYNVAHYTNLSSGTYTFKVASSNYDGIWDETPTSYHFTIHPPWYLTFWAFVGYAVFFLLLIFMSYAYLKWRWRMQLQLRLEHEETERLKNLDELKTKLYTNISHEFRTPLTLITGPIQQLITSSKLGENNKKALDVVANNADRMLQLVNQLLDLSKLESGTVTPKLTSNNLHSHITQMIESFTHIAKDGNRTIKSELNNIGYTVYDKDILEKIVTNLLQNAIKYSPEGSQIIFLCDMKDHVLHISISNENTRLAEADLSTIFQRFYQAESSSEGIGVGLSLVKELIHISKGTIHAERIDAQNVVFKVTLPMEDIKNEKVSEEIADAALNVIKEESHNSNTRPVLLVVEDNIEIMNYVISIFEKSFETVSAANGQQGIQNAIELVPDIIISDIMMPIVDGIELCNTLKTDQRTSHIPIILLTAKVGAEHELIGLQSQANHYITKPFHANILQQTVANCLSQQKLLQEKYSQYIYLKPKEIVASTTDEKFFELLQEVIDHKIMNTAYNAVTFSKDMGLSRMQLHRKLNALTGLNTTEFIRTQRMKSSEELLKNTDLTVAEIAYTVGFNTSSYFTKCFKEMYGITPTHFRDTQALQ